MNSSVLHSLGDMACHYRAVACDWEFNVDNMLVTASIHNAPETDMRQHAYTVCKQLLSDRVCTSHFVEQQYKDMKACRGGPLLSVGTITAM